MTLTPHQINALRYIGAMGVPAAIRTGQVGLSTARVLASHDLIAIRSVGVEALATLTDAGRAVIA